MPKHIAENIEHFTGRTWLLPIIIDWFDKSDERMFILTGDPGTGKSMIAAWLTGGRPIPKNKNTYHQLDRISSWLKAAHFCVANSGTTDPKEVAHHIANQLTDKVPGFSEAISSTLSDQVQIATEQHVGHLEKGGSIIGNYIANLNLSGLSEELSFNRILCDPLKRLYENGYNKPMLLLVDSLDEALTYTGATKVVYLLSKLTDLPAQVRFLTTTRSDPRVLKYFHKERKFDLIKNSPAGTDDIKLYINERIDAYLFELEQVKCDLIVNRISEASKGIFLYVSMVLRDILSKLPEIPDLANYPIPNGLSGLYHDFLVRELGNNEDKWYQEFKPLLGLIAVSQGEGLTKTQLEQITEKDLEQTIRICRQYLIGDPSEGPFQIFHKSFTDFLLEDPNNIDYHIDNSIMHRLIVDHYRGRNASWSSVNWEAVDPYCLIYLPFHALQSGDLPSLLEQPGFLIHCNPTEIRNAYEHSKNLSVLNRTITAIFSLAYPHLIFKKPSYRAAILHLTSVKQRVHDVAILFKVKLTNAPFQAAWAAITPDEIPYRQRITNQRIEAFTTVNRSEELSVIFVEEIRNDMRRLSVWEPSSEEIRSIDIKNCLRITQLIVVQAGERTFLELHDEAVDSDNMRLVDIDSLETIHHTWNGVAVAVISHDELMVAEADFSGALFLRSLEAIPMGFYKGNELIRNAATLNEIPLTILPDRIKQIIPLVNDPNNIRLVIVDNKNRQYIHDLFGDRSTVLYSDVIGRGLLVVKEVCIKDDSMLAVLSTEKHLIYLLDLHDGHIIDRLDDTILFDYNEATHWKDINILETNEEAFLLISTSSNEVLFWNIARRQVVRSDVFENFIGIVASKCKPIGSLITGHDNALNVWNAHQYLIGQQSKKEYTQIMVGGVVNDVPIGVTLTSYIFEKERQVRVFNLQSGEVIYENKAKVHVFRPHFMALCEDKSGPFIVFQPDWYRDILEVHSIAKGAIPKKFNIEDREQRPSWMDDPGFRIIDFNQTLDNPSRAYKTFISKLLQGQTRISDFWEEASSHCILERQGKVLASRIFKVSMSQKTHQSYILLLVDNTLLQTEIDLNQSKPPDLLDILFHDGKIITALLSNRNTNEQTIFIWQTQVISKPGHKSSERISVFPQIDLSYPAIASLVMVDDQLILAFAQKTKVTVSPLLPGPMIEPIHIPEQVNGLIWCPDATLLMTTSKGILAVSLRSSGKQNIE